LVKSAMISTAVVTLAVATCGCSGSDSADPTNTAHSAYNNKGDSAADKIGALRLKRRLMQRAGTPTQTPPAAP